MDEQTVRVPVGPATLEGTLTAPPGARGVVLFAHGSGSSRHSPRNRFVAGQLQHAGLATLLIDLLDAREEAIDVATRRLRFDIDLLAERLLGASRWLRSADEAAAVRGLGIGYFGASTGAGAALLAAARESALRSTARGAGEAGAMPTHGTPGVSATPGGSAIRAIVSRGGRPDLAGAALHEVSAPTLLIVGGDDVPVIQLNQEAFARLTRLPDAAKRLEIVSGATHLFEEPGTLEQVARLAADWFTRYLPLP